MWGFCGDGSHPNFLNTTNSGRSPSRSHGVLVNMYVGLSPEKYQKGPQGRLNVEKLADDVLDFMSLQGIDDTGIKKRSLRNKIAEAIELLDDLKSGVVRR